MMNPAVQEFARLVKHAILIPRGTKASQCRGARCDNREVYFVGNRIVSIRPYLNNPAGVAPTETTDGIGIDHHADCPDASSFTNKRAR